MAQSRKNPKRKQKLQTFKTKHKQQKMSTQTQNPQNQLPLVRNVPVWDSNVDIVVKGFEWEAIQNGLVSLQLAQQASQSVMSRNILENKISMKFEKLNPLTVQYEPMTDEEAVPYLEEWKKLVEAFKAQQAGNVKPDPQGTKIVTPEGEPAVTTPDAEPEKPKRKRAKVVKMDAPKA